jgi:hypothetical protein
MTILGLDRTGQYLEVEQCKTMDPQKKMRYKPLWTNNLKT